jgi:riboflavin synthase
MFTGIVEELGTITSVHWHSDDAAIVRVRGDVVTADAHPGDSIAVNGVCLTVVDVSSGEFTADVMRETLVRTSLRSAAPGVAVNLERAVTPSTRLGGHIVQGHVDGVGEVISREPTEHWELVRISVPPALRRYIVEKGSITVDGVSLTVATLDDTSFTVSLIPTTLSVTTLGHRVPGDIVNLEVDVLAKYVESLINGRSDA